MSSRGLMQLRGQLRIRPWLMTCHSLPPQERKLPFLHGNDAVHYAVRAARFLPHALAWRGIFLCGLVPRVVVHSPKMAQLVAGYGQPVMAIDTILLGVDGGQGELTIPDEPSPMAPRLTTIAGVAHTKGYHDALHAISMLRARFPGLRYQIIGEIRDWSYMAFLRRVIERRQLSDVVRVTPNLSEAEKQRGARPVSSLPAALSRGRLLLGLRRSVAPGPSPRGHRYRGDRAHQRGRSGRTRSACSTSGRARGGHGGIAYRGPAG